MTRYYRVANDVLDPPDHETYTTNVNNWLNRTGISLEMVKADNQTCPTVEELYGTCPHNHGPKYKVIFRRTNHNPVRFSFWASKAAIEEMGVNPTAYTILTFIADITMTHSYPDWLNSFRLRDSDAHRIYYHSYVRLSHRLRQFFGNSFTEFTRSYRPNG